MAGQVFLSLVTELKDQGLGNKVIADMFGLALRTYHKRVRRYSESATDRGISLWDEATGGSTYHFDLHEGHPLEEEVLGFLREVRRRASELRARVNQARTRPVAECYRVVFYAGQNVVGREGPGEGAEE